LDILDDVTIQGAGMNTTTIDANGIDRIFQMDGHNNSNITLNVSDLTLKNGHPYFDNSCRDNGGAIFLYDNTGTLNVSRVMFQNNSAPTGSGGAIFSFIGNNTINIDSSIFDGNIGGQGGALSNYSGTFNINPARRCRIWRRATPGEVPELRRGQQRLV
jgi:predicted outer membrane repeat protein